MKQLSYETKVGERESIQENYGKEGSEVWENLRQPPYLPPANPLAAPAVRISPSSGNRALSIGVQSKLMKQTGITDEEL